MNLILKIEIKNNLIKNQDFQIIEMLHSFYSIEHCRGQHIGTQYQAKDQCDLAAQNSSCCQSHHGSTINQQRIMLIVPLQRLHPAKRRHHLPRKEKPQSTQTIQNPHRTTRRKHVHHQPTIRHTPRTPLQDERQDPRLCTTKRRSATIAINHLPPTKQSEKSSKQYLYLQTFHISTSFIL